MTFVFGEYFCRLSFRRPACEATNIAEHDSRPWEEFRDGLGTEEAGYATLHLGRYHQPTSSGLASRSGRLFRLSDDTVPNLRWEQAGHKRISPLCRRFRLSLTALDEDVVRDEDERSQHEDTGNDQCEEERPIT